MSVTADLTSPATLTLLKVAFLAALYLFLFRAVRAVYLEMSPRRLAASATPAPAAPPKRETTAPARRGTPTELRVIAPPDQAGPAWALQGELVIGRGAGCSVQVDDGFVSQSHTRVFPRDGHWYAEDLGSTNGTFVNEKAIAGPTPVRKGDRIQVGETVLELRG